MADNGMNNIAEPELQLEQLEQVSGGIDLFIRSTEPEPNESDLVSHVNAAGICSGGTPEDPAAEPKTTKTAKVISRRVTSL